MGWSLFKNKIKEKLGIKDRLYKCECCGIYTHEMVVVKGLPPFENKKQRFCCEDCKEVYIDCLLPIWARRY